MAARNSIFQGIGLSLLFLGVTKSVRMNSREIAGICQYGQSTNYGAFSFCQRVGAAYDLCAWSCLNIKKRFIKLIAEEGSHRAGQINTLGKVFTFITLVSSPCRHYFWDF